MHPYPTTPDMPDDLAEKLAEQRLDLRMVLALAGERDLTAREQVVVDKLKGERGESLFSDMLYTLTHKTFPSRQAKTIWAELATHRQSLAEKLGRDMGLMVSAHDYLTNRAGILKNVSLIEEGKLTTLADAAVNDGLTGLTEKKTFLKRLSEELERQHRYGGKLSLLLLDIDHFKRLNDTFGHADGDVVLQQVAEIMRQQVRTTDVAARYGGEEFAILLTGVGLASATILAERLRQALQQHFANTPYKTTASMGLAESNPASKLTADAFIRLSDKELYRAKENGRNRVSVMTAGESASA
ncbi:MAG: GGDEF domain-containing protein [Alphaproteobacteria bacterium]